MSKWFKQIFNNTGNSDHSAQNLPAESASQGKDEAVRLKQSADEHMRKGEYDAAAKLYRESIARQSDFAEAHCNLGFVLWELRQLDQAEQSLQTAIRLKSTVADAHFFAGLIRRDRGDAEAAAEHLQNAISVSRDFEQAYIELNNTLNGLGRKEEACALLIEGAKEISESVTLQLLLAQALFDSEKYDDALAHFKQSLILAPAEVKGWIGVANCAKFCYDIEGTISNCRIALKLEPRFPGLQEGLDEAEKARQHFDDTAMLIKARGVDRHAAQARKVRLVCATRSKAPEFMRTEPLGQSAKMYTRIYPDVELQLFDENTEGLPTIYNRAIDYAKRDPAILVFIHDDVHVLDFFWPASIREALDCFDIVGLAGNTRRVPGQVAWCFLDQNFGMDEFQTDNLSGMIGGGTGFPGGAISVYGPAKRECKLLDGVFLAIDSEKLIQSGLRFDENFKFHFYDMDFCRQAELTGLKMGTWPISLIHSSGGNFASASWWEGWGRYRAKYNE